MSARIFDRDCVDHLIVDTEDEHVMIQFICEGLELFPTLYLNSIDVESLVGYLCQYAREIPSGESEAQPRDQMLESLQF